MPRRSDFDIGFRPEIRQLDRSVGSDAHADDTGVEIARLHFKYGDSKCVRILARRQGDRIAHQIQKDSSPPYDASPQSSLATLTFGALIDLIEDNVYPKDVRHFNRSNFTADQLADFIQASSDYYPELQRWYEREGKEWARARKSYIDLNATLYATIAIVAFFSATTLTSLDFDPIDLFVIATFTLSAASVAWSEVTAWSLTQTGRWLLIGVSAIVIAPQFSLVQCAVLIACAALLNLALGVIFDIATEAYRPFSRYRFSVVGTPSWQAESCMSLLFSTAYLHSTGVISWSAYAPLLILSVVLLLLTRSRTGFWLTTLAATIWTAFEWFFSLPPTGWTIFLAIAIVAIIIIPTFAIGRIGDVYHLGRNQLHRRNFNGRSALWRFAWKAIRDKPVLGYGYSVFWQPKRDPEVLRAIGWCPRSSHSIYLDTMLNVGPAGLVLLLGVFAASFVRILELQTPEAVFVGTFVFYVGVSGMLESTFSTPNFRCFSFYLLACTIS